MGGAAGLEKVIMITLGEWQLLTAAFSYLLVTWISTFPSGQKRALEPVPTLLPILSGLLAVLGLSSIALGLM